MYQRPTYGGDLRRVHLYSTDLDGAPNVYQTASDRIEQFVEAYHFLHENSVHGLRVGGGVAPQSEFGVEIRRQFRNDVGGDLFHHFVVALRPAGGLLHLRSGRGA